MGYTPHITAVPPLISNEQLDIELFQMFDIENTGYIEASEMEMIGRAMCWKGDQSKTTII